MLDPFDGRWNIDLSRSSVFDDALGRHVPDEVGEETITLRIRDRVQDYEVLYGDRPKIRIGYTAPYDGLEWVPYAVREIVSESADPDEELRVFKERIMASGGDRERRFEVGKAYGLVRLVYVDEDTHYRVSMSPITGKAQHVMLRRMAADRLSYVATVLDVNGIVHRIRRFVRID